MRNTFLLQEIITDLVDTDKSLSKPLIKLLSFAKLIKNKELEDFVKNELIGYRDIEDTNGSVTYEKIPFYRKTSAVFFVDIQFGITQHYNTPFPLSLLPKEIDF